MTPVIDMATGAVVTTETQVVGNANDIGELKGLLASVNAQGMHVAIVRIPVRLFAIDEAYQTPLRTSRSLSYLTANFDDAKLLPVTGVPHYEEGKIYLTDGYGRWKASQIVDKRREKNGEPKKYECLDCLVILSAPTDPVIRRKFEAEQYAFQNKNVAKVTALQKHGAFECLEHRGALIINKLKAKYNFQLTSDKGNRSVGVIGSYHDLFNICSVHGEECGDFIMDVCKRAGFHLKANGYSTYVLRALKDVYRYYPEHKTETAEFLAKWLRDKDPVQFKARAVARYGLLDYKTACSLYLEDLLVDNIDLSHVRHVDGKTVTVLTKVS